MEHAIMVSKSSLFSGPAKKVSSLLRNVPRIQSRRADNAFFRFIHFGRLVAVSCRAYNVPLERQ
jgi:hypothetical protein